MVWSHLSRRGMTFATRNSSTPQNPFAPRLDGFGGRRPNPPMFDSPNAVQLHVSIDEIEPLIWRRLVLPADWNLEQLHLVIQAAFNWWNYHLHEFQIGGLKYGDAVAAYDGSCADDPRVFEEREVRLRDFVTLGTSFTYDYDFGDNWHHTVKIEEWLWRDEVPKAALCVDGARARPPEDVGGVPGYERFLEIMGNPNDPDYAETKRWCGGYFDPEWFDLTVVQKDVAKALKPNVRRRQYQPRPKR